MQFRDIFDTFFLPISVIKIKIVETYTYLLKALDKHLYNDFFDHIVINGITLIFD